VGTTRARGGIAITALPIVTTAHLPSAANNNYWPEIYTNQSLVEPTQTEYTDTPSPKTFGNTSLLDPQLFSRINDFADELLKGERSGKYSPIEPGTNLTSWGSLKKALRGSKRTAMSFDPSKK
jgi:hypothetical protein